MTALDGYPMATKRNRPGQALFTANSSSFIGGLIGMLILTFMGPLLADLGLKFGPAEMTSLLLVAMTSIGWLVGESPTKGVVLTMVGILLATMGMDTLPEPRYDLETCICLEASLHSLCHWCCRFSQVLKLMEDRIK
jgi:putative tricarboxylic transport membrane protein